MSFTKDQTAPAPAAPAKPPKPFPTLLSSPDAMLWAAAALDKQLADLDLLEVLQRVERKVPPPTTDEERARSNEIKTVLSGVIDIELQRSAMRAAAAAIRAAANEAKLLEARAAARRYQP